MQSPAPSMAVRPPTPSTPPQRKAAEATGGDDVDMAPRTAEDEAGADKADLVMVMVLLEDMAEFGEFNEVYAAWLEGTILPARAAYGVKELPAGAKVEVVARAVRGSGAN